MLSGKFLRATIGKGGVNIEAHGFAGNGCKQAVDNLVSRMNAQPVGEPQFTADYDKPNEDQVKELE